VTRPSAVGVWDVPLGLHAVVQVAGACSVRLLRSSVEPVCGLGSLMLVTLTVAVRPCSISAVGALSFPSKLGCPSVYLASICIPSFGARRGMALAVDLGATHEAAPVCSF
jgi:hypothetical protein